MPATTWIRIDRTSPHWPQRWHLLHDAPTAALVTGNPAVLNTRALAIVGTRGATPRGLAVARRLAIDLAERGWTIVSGLALGIDAEAHAGALEAGGLTVAVMATGPQRTYPTQHRPLRAAIERNGCCVTEQPVDGGPGGRWLFPRRNRLIAGLVEGVVVVEAPAKSGALSTATRAEELSLPIWAVPGPVDLQASQGCHDLLRAGAYLCAGAADVDAHLAPPRPPKALRAGPLEPLPGSAARWILDRLTLEGADLEDLRARWPGTNAMWSEGLLALELGGLIRRLPGGRAAPRLWRP